MRKFKIGMVAILMVVGSMAWAQNSATPQNQQVSKTPAERAAVHSKKLTEELGLNPDQQKNIYNFCLQRAQQEDADRTKFQNDKEGLKTARKQNEQNFETNLATVLNADQKTKYEQMKQEKREKQKENSESPVNQK
jgi:hypothetical protein